MFILERLIVLNVMFSWICSHYFNGKFLFIPIFVVGICIPRSTRHVLSSKTTKATNLGIEFAKNVGNIGICWKKPAAETNEFIVLHVFFGYPG